MLGYGTLSISELTVNFGQIESVLLQVGLLQLVGA